MAYLDTDGLPPVGGQQSPPPSRPIGWRRRWVIGGTLVAVFAVASGAWYASVVRNGAHAGGFNGQPVTLTFSSAAALTGSSDNPAVFDHLTMSTVVAGRPSLIPRALAVASVDPAPIKAIPTDAATGASSSTLPSASPGEMSPKGTQGTIGNSGPAGTAASASSADSSKPLVALTSVTPAAAQPGAAIVVTGSGFVPQTTYYLTFGAGKRSGETAQSTDGTTLLFTVPTDLPACQIPLGSRMPCRVGSMALAAGSYQLGLDGLGSGAAVSKQVPFTVLPSAASTTVVALVAGATSGTYTSPAIPIDRGHVFGQFSVTTKSIGLKYQVATDGSRFTDWTDVAATPMPARKCPVTTTSQSLSCGVSTGSIVTPSAVTLAGATAIKLRITLSQGDSFSGFVATLTPPTAGTSTAPVSPGAASVTTATPTTTASGTPTTNAVTSTSTPLPTSTQTTAPSSASSSTPPSSTSSASIPLPTPTSTASSTATTPTAGTGSANTTTTAAASSTSSASVRLTAIAPTSTSVGSLLTITGTNFSATGNSVLFNGVGGSGTYGVPSLGGTISVTVPSNVGPTCLFGSGQRSATCRMPSQPLAPGLYQITVTNAAGSLSNGLPLRITAPRPAYCDSQIGQFLKRFGGSFWQTHCGTDSAPPVR